MGKYIYRQCKASVKFDEALIYYLQICFNYAMKLLTFSL